MKRFLLQDILILKCFVEEYHLPLRSHKKTEFSSTAMYNSLTPCLMLTIPDIKLSVFPSRWLQELIISSTSRESLIITSTLLLSSNLFQDQENNPEFLRSVTDIMLINMDMELIDLYRNLIIIFIFGNLSF